MHYNEYSFRRKAYSGSLYQYYFVRENVNKQGRKLYIDAGKDLKIHKISKSVTYLQLLKNIDLEMLPHLKISNVTIFLLIDAFPII